MPHPRSWSDGPVSLTLFCGLPGCGKTTLAKALEGEGVGVRICTDDWQAALQVTHEDTGFHDRLQPVLYRHALTLLEHGTDVILEDGLWQRVERAEKLADARVRGVHVVLHVFEVPRNILWDRLRHRAAAAEPGAYPMTEDELDCAWGVFEAPSEDELAGFGRVCRHTERDRSCPPTH